MNRNLRINLFTVTVILCCIGIVMIYSASSIYAWEKYQDSFFFLKRHISFMAFASFLMLAIMALDYRRFSRFSKPVLLASILLLVLVLVPGIGREVAGARRWFRFKWLSFQPSELANLSLIMYIADFISRKKDELKTFWQGFFVPVAITGVAILLILAQPDLGTSIALGLVIFIMLFVAGVRPVYLASLFLASLPVLYLLIFSVPYRRTRVLAFLNPWFDPKGSGFQIIQSQIALGSGGVFGVGLGHSKQKLFYLPAAHTDFIFSIIGEELGLLGTVTIIVLFVMFIQQGLKIMKQAQNTFGYFVALGLVAMITLKALINIGVSCGVLPTKGLPLPFISYGGSSLVFDIAAVGILVNIARTGEYP